MQCLVDFLWAGEQPVPIQGYGVVDIQIQGPLQNRQRQRRHFLRLRNVAYCPGFASNPVSLRKLRKQGLWWGNSPGNKVPPSGTAALSSASRSRMSPSSDGPSSGAVRFPTTRPTASSPSASRVTRSATDRCLSCPLILTTVMRVLRRVLSS